MLGKEHHRAKLTTRSRLTLRLAYCVLFFLWVIALPSATQAHELRPAIVDLTYSSSQTELQDKGLGIDALVNLESLIAGIEPEHDNTDLSQNAGVYKQLRSLDENRLRSEFELFRERFVSAIQITDSNGNNVELKFESIDIPSVGNTDVPRDSRIKLYAELKPGTSALRWQWSDAFGEVIVRANNETGPLDFAILLSPGQQTDLIQFTKPTKQSRWHNLANYIVIGFEHILPKGLDHILFIVGLFLLTTKWQSLAVQATVFTLAHSITLALGATGVLRISPSVVEPLIALSIVVICIENLFFSRLGKWRIAIVFVFGLLHGLGFASVLDDVGHDSTNFLIALVGFNLGVELGQLTVVAICLFTVGFWFSKKSYYKKLITRPASGLIGLVGLYWFVQRAFF